MRVRISYGVEVEDVPNEAHELGTSVGTKLANAKNNITICIRRTCEQRR